MAKGKKLLLEQLKLVDIVIEVLDARIPISSANPDVHKLIGNKPRVVILNKEDLADPGCTKEWISWFKNRGIIAQGFDSTAHKGAVNLVKTVVNVSKSKMTRKKFLLPRATRAIVVGIPNVGKSTLINTLVRKKTAKTGNKPGVTKGKQWVRILSDLELLDTPGLLWPKFESLMLVSFSSYRCHDQVFDLVEVAIYCNKLKPITPIFFRKYKFFTLDHHAELLELFSQKRGFLQAGGSTDSENRR